ncbi:uncharacterized protein LOC143448680 [Clavelina lepadiformis]|uniref:uncharacterized protein LOC143448680 n=1 Tax=Clavelina lepadiformis TaxID=159417 RepID=UPI004042C25E
MLENTAEDGDNDLHNAVRLGDFDGAKHALNEGCHPDVIGLFEWSALHEASSNGDYEILQLLLEYGADPNKHDKLNSSTALHYAASENHSDCLRLLLERGGDASIRNGKGESTLDLVASEDCKAVLNEYGYNVDTSAKKPVSILKLSKKKLNERSEKSIVINNEPIMTSTRKNCRRSLQSVSSFNSDDVLSSPGSVDSGTFSPSPKHSYSSREAWDNIDMNSLKLPSSPARSQASSYGSMVSLSSSGCSAADDSAGQFVLSFQYNCKKQEFKIRIWEVILISLVAPSKLPKDTSMHCYLKSTIVRDDDYKPNPSLKRKSEVIRFQPGDHIIPKSETQCAMALTWSEKVAKMEFKNSISLDYTDIAKQTVSSSAVKICLCIRPKKPLISSKSKSHPPDPVLASFEIRMSDAVKRIMKESYDTERHDVLGITRQAFPLDLVVSDKHSSANNSFISDPSVHIQMSNLDIRDTLVRSASDGNLANVKSQTTDLSKNGSKVCLTSEDDRDSGIDKTGRYSPSSLDGVSSHATVASTQVSVSLPLKKHIRLKSVKTEAKTNRDSACDATKVAMPHLNNSIYRQFKAKHSGDVGRGRITQRARAKLKSSGRVLIGTANSVLHPNYTEVTALDDEEKSVGSPSEDMRSQPLSPSVHRHHKTLSTGSLVEVDESPSPSRRRRYWHPGSSGGSPLAKSPVRLGGKFEKEKSRGCVVDVDLRDTKINVADEDKRLFVSHVSNSATSGNERASLQMGPLDARLSLAESRRLTSRNSQSRISSSHAEGRRQSVLRRLVYDETTVGGPQTTNLNPCYVND